MNNQLIVFLRNAVKGKVKTRLAASIGDDKTLLVYQWLVSHTINIADKTNANVHLYFDQLDENFISPPTFLKHEQNGNDLGEKLVDSFRNCLSEEEPVKSVVIGSDCPKINAPLIEEAFEKLSDYDLVIGPAIDGGFYLLGLNKLYPDLFEGIQWGSDSVYRKIVSNAAQLNLSIFVLEPKRDIDDLEDYKLFEEEFKRYCLKELNHVTQG